MNFYILAFSHPKMGSVLDFVWSDRRIKYEGEYKNSKKHGQGTLLFPNGDKYIGSFQNNVQNGQGTHIWKDG